MNGKLNTTLFALILAAILIPAANLSAKEAPADKKIATVGPNAKAYEKSVRRAIDYLSKEAQADDGSYSGVTGPGITAMVTTALLRNGRTVDDPAVRKSLKYLEGHVRPDGGIYRKGSLYRNYETCLAIFCFHEANADGRYTKTLKSGEKFIRKLQWGEGLEDDDRRKGGAGYGKHKRPDLSNTAFFIEALNTLGAGKDDPDIKEALKFVSQIQNHESQHNTGPDAAKNPDGGFAYSLESSQAKKTANGGLRSYASMTYAGLKSMIYAGVDKNDPRVQAALSWIGKHYDLDTNPGMGTSGLYYYYHTFAKALDAVGEDQFVDADGKKHDWRNDLFQALAARQQKNGAWINDNARWMEGNPNLSTAFSLLALSYCRPKLEK